MDETIRVPENEITKVEENAPESSKKSSFEKVQPSVPHLCANAGSRKGEMFPVLGDTFFVGRSRNNHVVLADRSVSRKHAVINYVEGKYVISDLNSNTGTYVNGKKVHEIELKEDDIVGIGDSLFQFQHKPLGASQKRKIKKYMLWTVVIVFVLVVGVIAIKQVTHTWQEGTVPLSDKEDDQVKKYYERGVEFYNAQHDVEAAISEWRKAINLDPQRISIYSRKAELLIEKLRQTEEKSDSSEKESDKEKPGQPKSDRDK